MEYDKIVRDGIPVLITRCGGSCRYKRVGDEEAKSYLVKKLYEEIDEFRVSNKPEEIADILEVISFLVVKMGFSMEQIEGLRHKKFEERGGFSENIILLESDSK